MTRNTSLFARYWSWVKRLGKKKTLMALGHTLLRIVYHLLLHRRPYQELGPDYLDRHRAERQLRKQSKMIKQLEESGFSVTKLV